MSVSVVIPNYNGEMYLKACMESLMEQSLKADEIIIVDNASTDESVKYIKKKYSNIVKLICLEKNYGFSKAVNEGIKNSNSEFVVLLNNDTELHKEWLLELYNCIKDDESIFSACSKMLRFDNRNIIDDAGDEYTIFGWARKIGDGELSDKYKQSREVFSSCAGAAIYRKSIFKKIGLFDENFFAYLEDMDISYRARKLSARNSIYLIYKNMHSIQIAVNFVFILLGILIKWLYFSVKGLGRDYISGIIEGIRTRKKINRVIVKNNLYNYINIQKMLVKNTLHLFKRG